jgi:nucleoside-diphosphate-sugar epimerase
MPEVSPIKQSARQSAKQSVLVLGANGFIGRAVVARLVKSDSVIPICGVRRTSTAAAGAAEQRSVDALAPQSIAAAIGGVDCIVNCVAGDAATLVGSTRSVIAAARAAGKALRVIHLSSMAVYGSAVGLIDESAPMRGELGAYAQAKIIAEELAAAYPNVVSLRPGCVFGPHSQQWTVRYARLLCSRRLGDLGPAGDGQCNLVDVADVAEAVLCAISDPGMNGRAFNLATLEALSWNEFLSRFAIALCAVPVRRIGARRLKIEGKLLAPPLKILEIFGGRLGLRRLPPPIPNSLLRLMAQDIKLDCRRAQDDLGVRFKSVQQMLADAAYWYLNSGR